MTRLLKLSKAFQAFVDRLVYSSFSDKDIEEICEELLFTLVSCNIAFEAAEAIIDDIKKRLKEQSVKRGTDRRKIVKQVVREVLYELLESSGKADLLEIIKSRKKTQQPLVILFVGPNGHGKTTTIAKVAKMLREKGFVPVIAAADTFRAGAIEQIEKHATKLGIKVIKHRYGADPAAVAYDAVSYAKKGRADVVLIDTAGRLQTDANLMEEMKKIARVVKPDIVIFVGDALTGNDAVEQARKFDEAVGIDGTILTKTDADEKGGTAISLVYALRKPIFYLGTGQGYGDLELFSPEKIINQILPPEDP